MKYLRLVTFIILFLSGCQQPGKPAKPRLLSSPGPLIDTLLFSAKQPFHIIAQPLGNDLVNLTATVGVQPALNDSISGLGLEHPEFPDFNKDGYPDILLSYKGNNTTSFLYLYDPVSSKFRSIDGFINFPAAVQLQENTTCYYSYYSEGCRDLNWISDLFKIERFKAIKIGHIYGKGCDFNVLENPRFIGIYKIDPANAQSEELLEKLPYLKYISRNEDKLDFLKKFWNKNYHKFE